MRDAAGTGRGSFGARRLSAAACSAKQDAEDLYQEKRRGFRGDVVYFPDDVLYGFLWNSQGTRRACRHFCDYRRLWLADDHHRFADIFSEFDMLAEKYSIEKIKTIGDAYMAAGGLRSTTTHYVDAMADMALQMQAFVARYTAPNGERMSLRVGLATGAVVAGVIGRRKFSYDLWGDTVNVAARMSSEAHPGLIQVDAVTYRRLHNRYAFDEMQQIDVKGKGMMQVYNLLGAKLPADDKNVVSIVPGGSQAGRA